jgi:hypothetical protein
MGNVMVHGHLWRFRLALGLAFVFVAGCSSWQVIRQADPNPFSNTGSFAVAPVSFDGALVNGSSEDEWVGSKKKEAARWEAAKRRMDERYLTAMKRFVEGISIDRDQQYEQYIVVARVRYVKPGWPTGQTSITITVKIRSLKEKDVVYDEIQINLASGGRKARAVMGELGEDLGQTVARYLNSRVL